MSDHRSGLEQLERFRGEVDSTGASGVLPAGYILLRLDPIISELRRESARPLPPPPPPPDENPGRLVPDGGPDRR